MASMSHLPKDSSHCASPLFKLKRNIFLESLRQKSSIKGIKLLDPYIFLILLSTDNGPNKVALCGARVWKSERIYWSYG